jgi:hypothetical protein
MTTWTGTCSSPHHWIVRMTDNDGPAISVERLLLTSNGEYTREGLAIRGRDFHAIDTISPFPLRLTWEALTTPASIGPAPPSRATA